MKNHKTERIKKQYYANGKFLLTGEYVVLDGAKALALPTKLGQSMKVSNTRGSDLIWEAIDHTGTRWFKSNISLYDFSPVSTTDEAVSNRLQKMLKYCVRQNSEFLSKWNGFKIQTTLDFDRSWGLGSSSSLYCLLAEWADVNPLMLYFAVEEGSGYDVACGIAEGPILYTNSPEEISYVEIDYTPTFSEHLYFIYTGVKKDSQEALSAYKKIKTPATIVDAATELTKAIQEAKDLQSFERLIDEHEALIGRLLSQQVVKAEKFSDYWGSIKSLGAWGGDFILATSDRPQKEVVDYFKSKGLETILPYHEIIL